MKKILLVEDEEMLLNVLASVLEEEGYTVRRSASAEEALKILSDFSPDLIISDIKLIKADGFTILEYVRGNDEYSEIPFVCLTALDDRVSQQRAKRLGASAYLTKPFDVDDLVKLINQILVPAA